MSKKRVKELPPDTLVCSVCGSADTQTKRWVHNLTNKVGDLTSDGEEEDNWCNDCQAHTPLTFYSTYQNHKKHD